MNPGLGPFLGGFNVVRVVVGVGGGVVFAAAAGGVDEEDLVVVGRRREGGRIGSDLYHHGGGVVFLFVEIEGLEVELGFLVQVHLGLGW